MNIETERVERLLALLLIEALKGGSQEQKAWKLNQAGFSNAEIAELLQTKPAVVATHLYARRKNAKVKKKRSP